MVLRQQHHGALWIVYLSFALISAVRGTLGVRDVLLQLDRLELAGSPALIYYDHPWWICKRPHLCPRCRGFLTGVGAVLAGWVLAVFLGQDPGGYLVRVLGVANCVVFGSLLLFITPVHGAIGRFGMFAKDSFWESDLALKSFGFLTALAGPLLTAVAWWLFTGNSP